MERWLRGKKGDESKQGLKLEDKKTQGRMKSDKGRAVLYCTCRRKRVESRWGSDLAYFALVEHQRCLLEPTRMPNVT